MLAIVNEVQARFKPTSSSKREAHLDIDDLIPYQGLQEYTDQPNQSVLHILVLDVFAAGDTVGYVQVNELGRQIHTCGQTIHHLGER